MRSTDQHECREKRPVRSVQFGAPCTIQVTYQTWHIVRRVVIPSEKQMVSLLVLHQTPAGISLNIFITDHFGSSPNVHGYASRMLQPSSLPLLVVEVKGVGGSL